MKKRIFMLAMIAALVLSFGASAWAATNVYFYKLGDIVTSGNFYEVEEGATITVEIDVTVNATRRDSESGSTYTLAEADTDAPAEAGTYYKYANILKWVVGDGTTFTVTGMTIKNAGDTGTGTAIDEDLWADPGYALTTTDFSLSNNSNGSFHKIITVTGTANNVDDATLPISVSLYRTSDGSSVSTYDADTELEENPSGGSDSESIVVTERTQEEFENDTNDPRDPASSKWNGLDPTFPNTISGDYGKAKPKLGKIEKANLSFTSSIAKDLEIPITGPVTEVDVYVAAKDAIKLGWLGKGATTNIQLNQKMIESYDIPFRVTSYDFATTVAGSDTKTIQKNWKSAENTLTLSFNGGKYAMKGFPITISMANSNTGSKPVAKAVKLDVTPNTVVPEWVYSVTSVDSTTTSEDEAEAWREEGSGWYKPHYTTVYVSKDETGYKAADWGLTAGTDFTVDVAFLSTDTNYYVVPSKIPDEDEDTGYAANSDYVIYDTEATYPIDYYTLYYNNYEAYTKKDKPEISAVVDTANEEVGDLEGEFTVSADGPYTITVKPAEDDKLKKFFSEYTLDIVQPTFNYLGEVEEPGYVLIWGIPTNKTKESKLALTLTATNPFTKKKGALKVTVSGKLAPYFEKLTDDGYITTKRVEAGKVPSVKFKAKGSKTIAYKLGSYYWDSDEGLVANDEAYNTELEAKLAALALSFDAKKGAVILADKQNKNTLPTLNEDGTAFESLDIVVTAYNNVGAAEAYAAVAITGAKPKMSTKTVEYTGGAATQPDKYLVAKVGKADATASTAGANVKFSPATDTDATTLSGLGLELLAYDELTVTVSGEAVISDEVTIAAGETVPDDWTTRVVSVTDSDGATVDSDSYGTAVKKSTVQTGYTVVIYSGDKTVKSGDVTVVSADESLKNQGILRVSDPSKMVNANTKDAKHKVNVIIENFGATNKGSFTIVVKPGTYSATTSAGALPATNKTVQVDAKAAKTNGTAGLTYNGAAPEADAESESEAEATVTIGSARTAADLTTGQQAYLAAKGLKVIAVLPEISANVEGQHEFPVTLDEDAPEGAKMVYVPFPQNAEETEDDKIADFYGADGEPIEDDKVPADKNITVAPWLREGVTYQPVIAAKDAE